MAFASDNRFTIYTEYDARGEPSFVQDYLRIKPNSRASRIPLSSERVVYPCNVEDIQGLIEFQARNFTSAVIEKFNAEGATRGYDILKMFFEFDKEGHLQEKTSTGFLEKDKIDLEPWQQSAITELLKNPISFLFVDPYSCYDEEDPPVFPEVATERIWIHDSLSNAFKAVQVTRVTLIKLIYPNYESKFRKDILLGALNALKGSGQDIDKQNSETGLKCLQQCLGDSSNVLTLQDSLGLATLSVRRSLWGYCYHRLSRNMREMKEEVLNWFGLIVDQFRKALNSCGIRYKLDQELFSDFLFARIGLVLAEIMLCSLPFYSILLLFQSVEQVCLAVSVMRFSYSIACKLLAMCANCSYFLWAMSYANVLEVVFYILKVTDNLLFGYPVVVFYIVFKLFRVPFILVGAVIEYWTENPWCCLLAQMLLFSLKCYLPWANLFRATILFLSREVKFIAVVNVTLAAVVLAKVLTHVVFLFPVAVCQYLRDLGWGGTKTLIQQSFYNHSITGAIYRWWSPELNHSVRETGTLYDENHFSAAVFRLDGSVDEDFLLDIEANLGLG